MKVIGQVLDSWAKRQGQAMFFFQIVPQSLAEERIDCLKMVCDGIDDIYAQMIILSQKFQLM